MDNLPAPTFSFGRDFQIYLAGRVFPIKFACGVHGLIDLQKKLNGELPALIPAFSLGEKAGMRASNQTILFFLKIRLGYRIILVLVFFCHRVTEHTEEGGINGLVDGWIAEMSCESAMCCRRLAGPVRHSAKRDDGRSISTAPDQESREVDAKLAKEFLPRMKPG
jgi:hypothetical protein